MENLRHIYADLLTLAVVASRTGARDLVPFVTLHLVTAVT